MKKTAFTIVFLITGILSWSQIGIGTITPDNTLSVVGEINLREDLGTGSAILVSGDEALWYNGTYFSWGFGGSANYFADNVGVGTTTPNNKLVTVGTISAAFEAAQTNRLDIGHGGGNTFINTVGAGRLDFRHEGTTGMTFTDANRLGINITNPSFSLSVGGTANLNEGIATGSAIRVNGDEALWYNGTYFSWGFGGSANFFSNNVGIGTTTPNDKLVAVGTISAAFENAQTNKIELAHGGANAFINTVGAGRLDFRHEGATGMSFTDANRLGINTSSPNFRLSVAGTTNFNEGIASGVALRVNGTEALWFDGSRFSWGFGGTENYFVDSVGIGGATPHSSAKLDVSSNNKGMLIPRMTAANRIGIGTPAEGLLVYQTDDVKGFYYFNATNWTRLLDRADNTPVGSILSFATGNVPNGYLECNGQAINRITFASLFSIIGVTYGNGNGSTTFNIPDYRGQFLRGYDHGAGVDPATNLRTDRGDGIGGDVVGSKQNAINISHLHGVDPPNTQTDDNSNGWHQHSTTSANITTGGNTTSHQHNVDFVTNQMQAGIGASKSYVENIEGSGSTGAVNHAVDTDINPFLLHDHSVTIPAAPTTSAGNHTHDLNITQFNSNTSGGAETRPINISVMYCIKY